MPFLAIAVGVSLVLGGSVAVAHTPAGEKAIESAATVWTDAKAKVLSGFSSHASSSKKMSADADVGVEAKTDLSLEGESKHGYPQDTRNSNGLEIKVDSDSKIKIF